MRRLAALLALCAGLWFAPVVAAEQVVAGLSRSDVAITARFEGSDILVFGAVRREVPIPEGAPLEVIVTVQGPSEPVVVRRKSRLFGIWVNTDAVTIDRAPTFYAVASTAPLADILAPDEDARWRISVPRAVLSFTEERGGDGPRGAFTEALLRIRTAQGSYQALPGTAGMEQQTLFRADIGLPANLTEGSYRTRIFLTRDGRVVDRFETPITVRKVGLERWLFNLSRRQPLAYGLLAIALAAAAGWAAATGFRLWSR
ncbi:MAG: TIGR02186 family protein [Rhodobacteraceae bacterium]|nr:TIGR02186 family protein [Paracoccaceae bacterium]